MSVDIAYLKAHAPSSKLIRTTPYVVFKDETMLDYFQIKQETLDSNFNQQKRILCDFLEQLIKSERTKEQAFLEVYFNNFKKDKTEIDFIKNIENSIKQEKNFSQVFTAMKLREKELISGMKVLDEELKKYQKQWDDFQNKKFLEIFKQGFKIDNKYSGGKKADNIMNITVEQYLSNVIDNFKESLKEVAPEFQDYYKEIFSSVTQNILHQFKNKADVENLDKIKDRSIAEIFNDISFEKVTKKNITKGKTISQWADSFIGKLGLSGLSAELTIVLDDGARTGGIQQERRNIQGRKSSGQIQTDAIQLVSAEIEVDQKFQRKLNRELTKAERDGKVTLEKLKQTIQQKMERYTDKSPFLVHYSAKDYTESFFDSNSSPQIHIRGSGSLNQRIADIQQIGQHQNIDTEELVFQLINTAQNAVAEDNIKNIETTITALCAGWMFEDFQDNFEITYKQDGLEQSVRQIHCYFVNGMYYLISDILQKVFDVITKTNEKQLVTSKIQPFKAYDFYLDLRKKEKEQASKEQQKETSSKEQNILSHWDSIRNATLNNTTLKIDMDLKQLQSMLNI